MGFVDRSRLLDDRVAKLHKVLPKNLKGKVLGSDATAFNKIREDLGKFMLDPWGTTMRYKKLRSLDSALKVLEKKYFPKGFTPSAQKILEDRGMWRRGKRIP